MNRTYNIHAIYDEIGRLEGKDLRLGFTKGAKKFKEPPLLGLWHKHHFQAGFIPRNLLEELKKMERNGSWEAMLNPHYMRPFHEVMPQIIHELVMGSYSRRAARHDMTGEFIVYEKRQDGSNYYLTLGSHGEYDAIRARVDEYKQFDLEHGW